MPDMLPLYSTDLAAYSYDVVRKSLLIQFHSGGLYRYQDVPPSEVEAWLAAPSQGKYFHQHIKKQYETEKIG